MKHALQVMLSLMIMMVCSMTSAHAEAFSDKTYMTALNDSIVAVDDAIRNPVSSNGVEFSVAVEDDLPLIMELLLNTRDQYIYSSTASVAAFFKQVSYVSVDNISLFPTPSDKHLAFNMPPKGSYVFAALTRLQDLHFQLRQST